MKAYLTWAIFLAIGMVIGFAGATYLAKQTLAEQSRIAYAGILGEAAMTAEFLKSGEVDYVIKLKEGGIPEMVETIFHDQKMRNSAIGLTSLQAAKRFYVCTNTDIPGDIKILLEDIPMFDNGCNEAAPEPDDSAQ